MKQNALYLKWDTHTITRSNGVVMECAFIACMLLLASRYATNNEKNAHYVNRLANLFFFSSNKYFALILAVFFSHFLQPDFMKSWLCDFFYFNSKKQNWHIQLIFISEYDKRSKWRKKKNGVISSRSAHCYQTIFFVPCS